MTAPLTVLVVGATGSIGSLAVAESLAAGHRTRALVRDQAKAHRLLPHEADVVVGDVTRPETLAAAVDGVDALVLTLGSDGGGGAGAESVDYAGVRNVLVAAGSRRVRIALMTAIGSPTGPAPTTSQPKRTTGNGAPNDSCGPAVTRTRSCDPAGSTTTPPTNTS